jgi:RNA polymerase sigma-70 factor (ECF subfamily)
VRRVAGGDRVAFRQLVDVHQRPLSAFARRMLGDSAAADDIVQETLLRLWTRADRFDASVARLTTWLHNIARNLCVDSLRRGSRSQALATEVVEDDGGAGPEQDEVARRRAARVRDALASLPERQRSALLLCHYQGLSNRDAAQLLGVGVEALESLLARARRRLRRELEAEL